MPLPIAGHVENEEVVAFHFLPFVSRHINNGKVETQYFFVGTKAECDRARDDLR